MRECARRKALGVAAFATAVGQYLATLDLALQRCGIADLADLVPFVDLGNEMDAGLGHRFGQ